jgi:hypothetical protein
MRSFAGAVGNFASALLGVDDFPTDGCVSIGTRIAAPRNVTIKHAVAALLFVAMLATPVTSVVCVGWCFPAEGPISTACHHATTMLAITGADANCNNVLANSPFLREEVQLITQAALPASMPLSALVCAAGEALLASGRDVDTALTRRATSPLVLRL